MDAKDKNMAQVNKFVQDDTTEIMKLEGMKDLCCVQYVSDKQFPITYSYLDSIFAWCYSEKTLNNHMEEDPNKPGVWRLKQEPHALEKRITETGCVT